MMTYINCQLDGDVFEIVFNRPEAYNFFHVDMFAEFKEACDAAEESSAKSSCHQGSGKRIFSRRRYWDDAQAGK
ncbi:hypothetical protein BsIDN1_18330 [Bacillus safensis]|uniref:Enoyl-CoA hydratase n=1 Tax=Bacillus safensis TaxID=561879 RepID=A0A5S9M5W7_BACIA|nr:hypothetical protein BsIDN1_18330 [Bacillus safensis]